MGFVGLSAGSSLDIWFNAGRQNSRKQQPPNWESS
uniref:Uncharacterized protein n=1 Tax=Rhizophora mucronata TaxID=61149 RepID=A0A2P2Q2Y4_RHIMU